MARSGKLCEEKSKTIEIIACIYDKKAADFAVSLGVNAFKVHTADLSNFPLLKHISQLNLRIDLSVGSSTFEEIAAALECINCSEQDRIWLMYRSNYFYFAKRCRYFTGCKYSIKFQSSCWLSRPYRRYREANHSTISDGRRY